MGHDPAGDIAVMQLEQIHTRLVIRLGAAGGQVIETPELVSACVPGAPVFYNQVARARFDAPGARRRVAEALAPFRAAGQRLIWCLPRSSAPDDLGMLLEAEGLRLALGESQGMVVPTAELRMPDMSLELAVEPTRDAASLSTWVNVFADGFGVPADFRETFVAQTLALELKVGIDSADYRRYLALVGDEAVAVCATYVAERTVGVFRVTTLENWRRRGIARRLVWHAVRESQGCELAVLRCDNSLMPVYAGLGFRRVCDMPQYFAPLGWA